MFKTIHDICYYGNGGYDHDTVYNMPIWLRRATYNFIVEQKQQESEIYSKSAKSDPNKIDFADTKSAKQKLQQSNTLTYNTRASKK